MQMPLPLRLIIGTITLLVLLLVIFAFAPVVGNIAFDQRSDAVSESLSCTTGSGETSCAVTLSNAHQNFDTTAMTITETAPGSATRSGTLNADDRTTLTVTGLSGSTSYDFTVAYQRRADDIDAVKNTVINWSALIFIAGLAGIAGLWGAKKIGVWKGS